MKRYKKMYNSLVLSKPWLTLLFVLGLVLSLGTYIPSIKLDASADALTLEYDKDLDFFREIYQRYQTGDFLVVTYTPKAELLSDETLQHLKQLRDELLTIEGVDSANSLLDVPLLYSPPVTLTEVSKSQRTLMDPDVDKELARQEFLESPVYRDMLLGPDGKTTAVLLNLAIDNQYLDLVRARDALRLKRSESGLTPKEAAELESLEKEFANYSKVAEQKSRQRVVDVRQVVAKYKDQADIFVGGVSMITADMVDFIQSDQIVFGSGISLFIVVLLVVIFRRWQFVLLPLTVCILSVTFMLGLISALDWHLTVISSNFVALLLIISLQITIHLIVRYRELLTEHSEQTSLWLVQQMLLSMAKPCLYTVLTTMVAFSSLVVSGIRPVIDFGWMMTLGLCATFLLSFTLLPAGLLCLPRPSIKTTEGKPPFSAQFARITEQYGRTIIALSLILVGFSVYGISQLKVENRFIDYFRSDTEIHQGMLVIDQRLGGTITLDIIIDSANNNPLLGLNEPVDPLAEADPFDESDPFEIPEPSTETDPFSDADPFSELNQQTAPKESYWFTQVGMSQIEQLHDYLELLPEVGKVQSLATLYKVATDLNGGKPLNNFELAVMRTKLPEDINNFLVDPYLDIDKDQIRITMRVKETDPNLQRDALIKKIRQFATTQMNFKEEQVRITGMLVLYNNMLQSLFQSQILTIGAVFIGIMLMFLVLFRSVVISLVALIPNILAAAIVLGLMGVVGIPMDMMTITIAAIAVGIGVDDAIHYVYRFRHEFNETRSYHKALHLAHGSIGSAMYYTSVTIIVGFSILVFSEFIPSVYFGLLTGLAMLAAIAGALTLLPKLLLLTKPMGKEVGD